MRGWPGPNALPRTGLKRCLGARGWAQPEVQVERKKPATGGGARLCNRSRVIATLVRQFSFNTPSLTKSLFMALDVTLNAKRQRAGAGPDSPLGSLALLYPDCRYNAFRRRKADGGHGTGQSKGMLIRSKIANHQKRRGANSSTMPAARFIHHEVFSYRTRSRCLNEGAPLGLYPIVLISIPE